MKNSIFSQYTHCFLNNNVPGIDFHIHTTWTDGKNSVLEMYQKALEVGLDAMLFSEHARKVSEEWFYRFAEEVRRLPQERCKVWVGTETKIVDFEGNLDTSEQITKHCDLVMASVHRFPGKNGRVVTFNEVSGAQALDMEYRLALAALDNPSVDILGHPFGMSYARYGTNPPWDKVCSLISKAAKTGVAIEINSRYHPNPWSWIHECVKAGALISLGSNAHSITEVGQIVSLLKQQVPQ